MIDGNYGGTLPLRIEAADTAIFLDVPRRTCLRRVLWRSVRGLGRAREDIAPGCREKLPDLEFLRWIWTYPSRRPDVLALLDRLRERGGRAVVLRTPVETAAFLDALPTAAVAQPGAVSIDGKVSEERNSNGR